jgi:hypothetical protein
MQPRLDSSHSLMTRSELKENILSPHSFPTASSEKLTALWLQIEAFDSQLTNYIDSRDKEYEHLKAAIDQADDQLRKRRADFREGFVRKFEDFKDHQTNIENFYKIELQRKNDFGRKVNDIVHERISEVSGTVDTHKSKTELFDKKFRHQTMEVITKLKEENEAIGHSHGDLEDNLGTKTGEFYGHIRQELSHQTRDSEDSEKAIGDLFTTMVRNVEERIKDESNMRKQNVERIVSMLEETCVRLESASRWFSN